MATSKAQLLSVFTDNLDKLSEYAEASEKSARGENSKWFSPMDWSDDQIEDIVEKLAETFDRSQLDEMVTRVLSANEPGTRADFVALQLMLAWIATLERAYRSRYQTPIRAAAHSAARMKSHGGAKGLFLRVHKKSIENLIKAGATTSG